MLTRMYVQCCCVFVLLVRLPQCVFYVIQYEKKIVQCTLPLNIANFKRVETVKKITFFVNRISTLTKGNSFTVE